MYIHVAGIGQICPSRYTMGDREMGTAIIHVSEIAIRWMACPYICTCTQDSLRVEIKSGRGRPGFEAILRIQGQAHIT